MHGAVRNWPPEWRTDPLGNDYTTCPHCSKSVGEVSSPLGSTGATTVNVGPSSAAPGTIADILHDAAINNIGVPFRFGQDAFDMHVTNWKYMHQTWEFDLEGNNSTGKRYVEMHMKVTG